MTWIRLRWFRRGTVACERCGDFPDLRPRSDSAVNEFPASDHPAAIDRASDQRPCVLMIDDSPAERDLYALMLERDVKVLTAARGAEGLTLAALEKPDAIVLDVMMPEMDGWEVCRRLKSNPATAAIPVIMLTAQDDPTLADTAALNGAATVLQKPCPVERLTSVVAGAISGSSRGGGSQANA